MLDYLIIEIYIKRLLMCNIILSYNYFIKSYNRFDITGPIFRCVLPYLISQTLSPSSISISWISSVIELNLSEIAVAIFTETPGIWASWCIKHTFGVKLSFLTDLIWETYSILFLPHLRYLNKFYQYSVDVIVVNFLLKAQVPYGDRTWFSAHVVLARVGGDPRRARSGVAVSGGNSSVRQRLLLPYRSCRWRCCCRRRRHSCCSEVRDRAGVRRCVGDPLVPEHWSQGRVVTGNQRRRNTGIQHLKIRNK